MSGRKPRLLDPFYFPAKSANNVKSSYSLTKRGGGGKNVLESGNDIISTLKENWLIVIVVIISAFFAYRYFNATIQSSEKSKEEKEIEEIEQEQEIEEDDDINDYPQEQPNNMRDHYYNSIPRPNGIEGFSSPGHQAYVNMLPNTLPGTVSPESSFVLQRQGPQSMQDMNQVAYSPHMPSNYEMSSDMPSYNANYPQTPTPYGHDQYVPYN